MIKEVYEATDPQRLLETEDGVWRIAVQETNGQSITDEEGHWVSYDRGDKVVFKTRTYVDADRGGFCGYLPHEVEIPASILLEAADALRAGELPRTGRHEY